MLRRVFIAIVALVVLLGVTFPAYAHHHKHRHHHKHHHSSSSHHSGHSGHSGGHHGDSSDDSSSDSSGGDNSSSDSSDSSASQTTDGATTGGDTSTDMAADNTASGTPATGAQQTMQVETTAYSFGDNQGGSNAKISAGVIHKEAAGDGSFQNPITLAVPGSGGKGMQTPKGTRVYFQKYRMYGIVEDSGATPKKLRRFDIWSDGRGNSSASACMDELTGTSTAILNPPAGLPVTYKGPRSDSKGCHAS